MRTVCAVAAALLIRAAPACAQLVGGPAFVLFDARNGDFGSLSSRAMNTGAGFESYGLVTEFLTTPFEPVPEPATFALMIGGLAMLLAARVRMRRTTRLGA